MTDNTETLTPTGILRRDFTALEQRRARLLDNVKQASDFMSEALAVLYRKTPEQIDSWNKANERYFTDLIHEHVEAQGDSDALERQELEVRVNLYQIWMAEVQDGAKDQVPDLIEKIRLSHRFLFADCKNLEARDREHFEEPLADYAGIVNPDTIPGGLTADVFEDFKKIGETIGNIRKKKPTFAKVATYLPVLNWAKTYKLQYLQDDISVGISSGTMVIPQAMAYAFLAGLPPIYGLYSVFIPTMIYALMGSSRHLAVGPLALASILVGAAIRNVRPDEEMSDDVRVGYAHLLGLLVGINFLMMSFLQLSFLVNFLSRPVLSGFTSAAAIIIMCSQLHYFFGVKVPSDDTYAWQMVMHLVEGLNTIVWWEVGMGIICMSALYIMKNYIKVIPFTKIPLPAPLILVIVGLIASYTLKFEDHNIAIVGTIPSGLPSVSFPSFTLNDVLSLYQDSLVIPIVGLMETYSAAKVAATKFKYELDFRQDLLALGTANTLGSFLGSYPAMGAFGRTALHMNSGGKTQLTSLISVAVVVVTLLFLTGLFYYLPKVVLASIVTFAVASLVDFEEIQKLSKFNKIDTLLLLTTFFVTLGLGVQPGILVAVAFSIILIIYQSSRPNAVMCGRLPGSNLYADIQSSPDVILSPHIVLFRFDAPLLFCNAAFYKLRLSEIMAKEEEEVRAVVYDYVSVTMVDTTGIKMLKELLREHNEKGIVTVFADVKPKVLEIFKQSGFYREVGQAHFFVRVYDAMKAVGADRKKQEADENDENSIQISITPIVEEKAGIHWNCFRSKKHTEADNYIELY